MKVSALSCHHIMYTNLVGSDSFATIFFLVRYQYSIYITRSRHDLLLCSLPKNAPHLPDFALACIATSARTFSNVAEGEKTSINEIDVADFHWKNGQVVSRFLMNYDPSIILTVWRSGNSLFSVMLWVYWVD